MSNEIPIFWDSSAIIKWYIEEEGSAKARKWFQRAKSHQAAAISHAEVLATLHRLRRDNLITEKEADQCVQRFIRDFQNILVLDYSAPVRRVAEELSAQVALRGADLVQLVSAVKLAREGIPVAVATFDTLLANAARNQDLTVL